MAAAEPEGGHGLPVFLFAALKFHRPPLKQVKLSGQYLFELNLALNLCTYSLGQTIPRYLTVHRSGNVVCATVPTITRLNDGNDRNFRVFSDVKTPSKPWSPKQTG